MAEVERKIAAEIDRKIAAEAERQAGATALDIGLAQGHQGTKGGGLDREEQRVHLAEDCVRHVETFQEFLRGQGL